MKILITGGSGVIGSKLAKAYAHSGHDVSYTFFSNDIKINSLTSFKLDISDKKKIIRLVSKIKPEIVFHTSALTDVNLCETNHELADRLNIQGTKNVVDACDVVGNKIAFISTSAVFDGTKKVFYESDKTNPINYYGHTKLVGEEIVGNSGLEYLILRTDQPYSWVEKHQKRNTVLKVLEALNNGIIFNEIIDWYNNPTYVENFVEVSMKLVELGKKGIYHVVGSDYISRYDWALKIAAAFGKNKKMIKPIKSAELKSPAKRANANLSNEKAQNEASMELVGIDQGLELMKQTMKE